MKSRPAPGHKKLVRRLAFVARVIGEKPLLACTLVVIAAFSPPAMCSPMCDLLAPNGGPRDSSEVAELERRGRIVAWFVLACVVLPSTIVCVARIGSNAPPAARTSKVTGVRTASNEALRISSQQRSDAQLAAALSHDLAPVSASRAGLYGLRAGSLHARAASARNIARLERNAASSLAGLATPPRDRQAMATLRSSLAAEAAAFAALGAAAAGDNRSAYAGARSMVLAASDQLSAAAGLLTRQGFVLPPLRMLYRVSLPSLPGRSGAPSQRQAVTRVTQQPVAAVRQQPVPAVRQQPVAPVTQQKAQPPSSSSAAGSSATPGSTDGKPLSPVVVVVPAGSTTSSHATPPSTVVVVPGG